MITDLSIRDLYFKILDYKGQSIHTELLKPWLETAQYNTFIRSLPVPQNMTDEDNFELYALSRVLDLLTLAYLPDNHADGSDWKGPALTLSEYTEFVQLAGFELIYPQQYDPFYCEIATAYEGEWNFEIVDTLFPAIKSGDLVIKRSAVFITLNRNDYDLHQINNATLYWTFRRKNKYTLDLSAGWGLNSQWRTAFRLDIETEQTYIYNAKGTLDLNKPDETTLAALKIQNLKIEEAIELLINRQFILCAKEDEDLFPYDFKYETTKHR